MRSLLILFIVLSSVIRAYSSDCKTFNKYELYNNSDVIFMGKIEEVQSSVFSVRIYEVFKGILKIDSIITMPLDGESILPEKNELWLLFGEEDNEGVIYISVCSGSKKFSWPYSEGFNVINYFEPPPQGVVNKESLILIQKMWQDRALNELYFDILNLRQLKLLQRLESQKLTNSEAIENQDLSKIIILNYILIGLVIIFGILIVVRFR